MGESVEGRTIGDFEDVYTKAAKIESDLIIRYRESGEEIEPESVVGVMVSTTRAQVAMWERKTKEVYGENVPEIWKEHIANGLNNVQLVAGGDINATYEFINDRIKMINELLLDETQNREFQQTRERELDGYIQLREFYS